MKEQIKKLLNVCGMPNEQLMAIYDDPNQTFYMEQFAELIVRECIAQCNDGDSRYFIATHFGIEE